MQSRGAARTSSWCVALAEYRLDDLARISGVSARNIRAYRERGLLDPPRRVGRSAYYDDYHLSQLKTINQLLRRGFNSAHIAEFFARMREGADLADILGIQQAILGPRIAEEREEPEEAPGKSVTGIDPVGVEARRLIDCGLAELADGEVVLNDKTMAAIVARAPEPLTYMRVILRMFDATGNRSTRWRFRQRARGAVHDPVRRCPCAQPRGDAELAGSCWTTAIWVTGWLPSTWRSHARAVGDGGVGGHRRILLSGDWQPK